MIYGFGYIGCTFLWDKFAEKPGKGTKKALGNEEGFTKIFLSKYVLSPRPLPQKLASSAASFCSCPDIQY